jgi:rhamnosyltransferase subunit B
MRVLLLPFGSLGHLNPFLGLGLALRERGHDVVVITGSYFEDTVKQTGLDFWSCSPAQSYIDLMYHADAWDPKKGPALIMRSSLEPMPEASGSSSSTNRAIPVMAAEPGVFAARIAQERAIKRYGRVASGKAVMFGMTN